jgi:FkbM family methyltransferase
MIMKYLKQQVRQYRLRQAGVVDSSDLGLETMSGWAVWPDPIGENSVVYSFGVGDNVGWDLEMIRRFGVKIHAFDPTPASIEWVAQRQFPPQFVFHDYGISDFDGWLDFYPPRRSGSTHFSQERRGTLFDRRPPYKGQVHRLETIMHELGHHRIDVLKLDVEGSEFEAIPDLVASGIEVDQLLIEIHYQFRSRSFQQGLDLIGQLKDYGMHCLHVSRRGYEFSFVRQELMERAAFAAAPANIESEPRYYYARIAGRTLPDRTKTGRPLISGSVCDSGTPSK